MATLNRYSKNNNILKGVNAERKHFKDYIPAMLLLKRFRRIREIRTACFRPWFIVPVLGITKNKQEVVKMVSNLKRT